MDKDSTDRTKGIANKYTGKIFNLSNEITLPNIKNYRGAQLNLGVEKAKGEIIFFPDADMTFDRELLKEAIILLNKLDALYIKTPN